MINKRLIRDFLYFPHLVIDAIFCYYYLGFWKPTWRLRGFPLIQKHRKAKILIGEKLILCSDPAKNSIGVFQKVIIKALNPSSNIKIGNNVGISGATISGRDITIGDNVLIGSGVLITDSDAHPIHPKDRNNAELIKNAPVHIEDDVFIGARSIILKGVTIGSGSVIGAGSVVSSSIPPMSICAGNPARVLKNII
ncbi:acyltransferase [Leeuwenhoekiella parthenopeia]|uniref:Acyltransferase n=1 Tax=Leeuwenhoekiella parthenopeia TaxID=2890320 RepID=A0ABS8GW85_9FLAO|nr:acyltransferase [Leeuwenhoekiella parthenopeia]MCC4214249.1 acyltransferase [Leeuwenhoekiella parthenopeia]